MRKKKCIGIKEFGVKYCKEVGGGVKIEGWFSVCYYVFLNF